MSNRLHVAGPRRRVAVRASYGLFLALFVMLALPSAAMAVPLLARDEILARAESALGTEYTWGGESWVPNASDWGPDCSGYVLKCWEAPRSMLYEEEDPGDVQRVCRGDFVPLHGTVAGNPHRRRTSTAERSRLVWLLLFGARTTRAARQSCRRRQYDAE